MSDRDPLAAALRMSVFPNDYPLSYDDARILAHVAREHIAAEIDAEIAPARKGLTLEYWEGWNQGKDDAARIARGVTDE